MTPNILMQIYYGKLGPNAPNAAEAKLQFSFRFYNFIIDILLKEWTKITIPNDA
jgi:hypothetical protein